MKLKSYNIPLLFLPVLIFSLGFISLLSTTPENAGDQITFFVISIFLYFAFSFVDHTLLRNAWKLVFGAVIFLLILTIVLGEIRFGASRWIDLGLFVIQPSEFAKIAAVTLVATFVATKGFNASSILAVLKIFAFIVPMAALVFFQPDLGTSVIIVLTTLGVLFYMGVNKLYFLTALLLSGAISAPIWELLKDYQKERILVFLNPNLDKLGMGYNVSQSIISIGAGQLLGKGFGYGSQSHLRFLPAFWTDFIFASFAEEWGFVGVFVLLLLYTLFLLAILYVAQKAESTFSKAFCIGVFFVFFLQFFVNVGMNLGVMPVTGIPLPLVSYGGSSLITSMVLLGILQNIWGQYKDNPTRTK
ncbi:MAG: rod shape-determining protein RodA [Patescibacteria group bacterium]|jgi:rod shape determining protein RodA